MFSRKYLIQGTSSSCILIRQQTKYTLVETYLLQKSNSKYTLLLSVGILLYRNPLMYIGYLTSCIIKSQEQNRYATTKINISFYFVIVLY